MKFLLPYDKETIPVEIAEQNSVGSVVSKVETYRPIYLFMIFFLL